MARGRPRAWEWMTRTASSEKRVSVRPVGQVRADITVGLGRGEGGDGECVLQLHALVEGCHVAHAQASSEGGLADEQDGQRGA